MKILHIYIIKNFVKIFLFTTSTLALIGIITELLTRMSFYIKYKASFYMILVHILSNIPWWLMQVLPIATLLAILFSLGDLSKKNEVIAIKAAGINIWQLIVLLFISGFVIGLCEFSVREFIVPKLNLYNEVIKKEKIKKEKLNIKTEFSNLIVSMPNNKRFTIGYLNTEKKIIKDIIIEKYNNEFIIERLVLAKAGVWENNTWLLKNGVIRNFDNNFWNEIYFKNYNSNMHISPSDMTIQIVDDHLLNIRAFKKYINQVRIFGQMKEERRVLIALNVRYATGFAHIIVMIIGIPFALGLGIKLNKILNFTFALFIAFIYWGIKAITSSLGENFFLSPFLAAWLPYFVFATIGAYFLVKVKK